MFGKKEAVLMNAGSMTLYLGEVIRYQDVATGKITIYEDRIEMKVQMGNTMKTAGGALSGAAIGGSIGTGISASAIKKGGTLIWYFRDIKSASAMDCAAWKNRKVLALLMRDGSACYLYPGSATAGKNIETVNNTLTLISSKL